MSTDHRTNVPSLPPDSHGRARQATDRETPRIRWTWVFLVSVILGTLSTCVDAPSTPILGPLEELAAPDRLSEIAKAMAFAMESTDVRTRILEAMRASPRVDHSLILGDYLSEARAQDFLRASASALNLSAVQFLSMIQGFPELEFVVPFTEHRLAWTGTSGIALGALWDSDATDLTVYEASGDIRRIKDVNPLGRYEALFVVRPRETAGTRIGRQADVPGPVIQDPNDGEDAIVVSFRIGNREPISFDIGQFSDTAEARQAIARGVVREFQLFSATEQSNTYADGHVTCQENPYDPDCVDCNLAPFHPICPPRPPGTGSYAVGDSPTFLDRFRLLRSLDPWDGDNEIRITLS